MKKVVSALLLIFAVHSVYHLAPAFSQETSDRLEIKKVINDYFDSMTYRDVGFAEKHISPRFSATIGGRTIDYENFVSFRNSLIERVHKNRIAYSPGELDIAKLEVGDNQAVAEAAFSWKALNRDTLEEITGKRAIKFTLVKENNSWNIISIANLPVLEADNSLLFGQDPDFPEVKKTVERYLEAFARKDVDSIMSVISEHYMDTFEGKAIDYDGEKKLFEFIFNVRLKKFNNCSISDVRYVDFEHKDGGVRVRVNYIWRGDNTETGTREGHGRRRDLELTKENGTWMITRVSIESNIATEDTL